MILSFFITGDGKPQELAMHKGSSGRCCVDMIRHQSNDANTSGCSVTAKLRNRTPCPSVDGG